MNDPSYPPSSVNHAAPRDYPANPSVLRTAILCIVPGLAVLALSFVFVIWMATRPATPERVIKPGFNSGFIGMIIPPIMATYPILYGLHLLRGTRRVRLDEHGVHIHGLSSHRDIPWNEIGSVDHGKRESHLPGKTTRTLEIRDASGRLKGTITDTLIGFDDLWADLIARSTAAIGRATHVPEEAEGRKAAKNLKRLRWAAWAFVFFSIAMGAAFGWGVYEELQTRKYATEGVEVEAKVLRTWQVSATPRIEYSFEDESGHTHTREAMMYQGREWNRAQRTRTIAVEYLPSSPHWNRIIRGEEADPQFSGLMLFITGPGFIVFGLLAMTSLLGYDLDVEPGVTKLMRHGRVLKEWRTGTKPPPPAPMAAPIAPPIARPTSMNESDPTDKGLHG